MHNLTFKSNSKVGGTRTLVALIEKRGIMEIRNNSLKRPFETRSLPSFITPRNHDDNRICAKTVRRTSTTIILAVVTK